MAAEKIMIVEDDEITTMNLKLTLEKLGYTIISTSDDILQARSKIKIYNPDLLLIDISIQDNHDGIQLGNYLNEHLQIPFIYLTSHSEENILDMAKNSEPYGYIVKPFEPKNLRTNIEIALHKANEERKRHKEQLHLEEKQQKLEKLLNAQSVNDNAIIYFADNYHIDVSSCETFYKNEKIKLTKKENAFIRLLVANIGKVVSFENALNYVWEGKGATYNSVRTLVWRLRSKLPTDIIHNSSGMGYSILH